MNVNLTNIFVTVTEKLFEVDFERNKCNQRVNSTFNTELIAFGDYCVKTLAMVYFSL